MAAEAADGSVWREQDSFGFTPLHWLNALGELPPAFVCSGFAVILVSLVTFKDDAAHHAAKEDLLEAGR